MGPPWATTTRLLATGDGDWIRDRPVETAARAAQVAAADAAWKEQAATLESRVPFYREHFAAADVSASAADSVRALKRLPTMTKDDLRRAEEEAPPFGSHLGVSPAAVKRVYLTSGSSGRPSIVALTRADLAEWTTIGARAYHATGLHPHHSVLTTIGAGPFVAGHTHATLDRIGTRRVPVAPGDIDRVLWALQAGLADTLLGTPSFAQHLASMAADRGIDGGTLGVGHLILGGEPGAGIPAVRHRLEMAFDADVTDVGGIGEVAPSLFAECPMKDGMHFCGQGSVWVELIDPATEEAVELEAGATGELVYTTLVREAQPVVRYRSRDIATITSTDCECGRTSFKIRITGRSDDAFIVRGVNVHPAAVQAVVAEFDRVVTGRARVVLPPDADVGVDPPVLVEAEVPDDVVPGAEDARTIAAAIRSQLNFRADVEFVAHADYGDPGYKTPLVVRRPARRSAPPS